MTANNSLAENGTNDSPNAGPSKAAILNGNEIIIQGGLEAGFSLYTGYPGSPLADYFNILHHRKKELEEKGIKVVIANSEANAAAMASGAKQAGRDCLVAMKSMGLHVASDALSVGNFANPGDTTIDPQTGEVLYPGVVIAVGDDPWSISTSTPADSRFLFKHLHIPFLEPSSPQELKDWMAHALTLSKKTSVYQGILLTTYLAEGGGRVHISTPKPVKNEAVTLDPSKFDLSKNVMVPPNSLKADIAMIEERFPKIKKALVELNLDLRMGADSEIGFISSGVIFETLKQVLEEGDYLDRYSLYKLASSYPLVDELLLPWLQSKKAIVVVEEKRGFLETEVRELCQKHGLTTKVFGKKFRDDKAGFPAHGGLSYEVVRDKVKEVLEDLGEKACEGLNWDFKTWNEALPKRLPTFCPGCPHRETLSLLKDLRRTLKDEGVDLITHGDVGCYSLSFLPPFKEMHNLSAMGQGGALGAGVDMFTSNPSVVLMGDSTFFHSGITDISNSVQAGHDITYILLDNDNTAMTGHQMTPASGMNVAGKTRPRQDMLSAVYSLGVDFAKEVNPSDRFFYKSLLRDVVKKKGVKVIVSNKECALTFHGRKKRQERKLFANNQTLSEKVFYQINTDACEDCRACVEATGCPGLGQMEDAYGTKVMIDQQICVADSYCTKIKACPSFEEVIVKDYHPTKYQQVKERALDQNNLPAPEFKVCFEDIASGKDLRVVVTGVGGSGVTTISRVLAEAAKEMGGREDLDFKFVDQKGLAQRNGNVTGHLSIFKKGKSYGAVTPSGTADLLVSPDLLDGSQHIHYLSKDGLAVFDKRFQIPLSLMLDDGEENRPLTEGELRKRLSNLLGDQVEFYGLKDLSYKALGKGVYASAMILGVVFQSGRLPFSEADLRSAFESTMPKAELTNNWQAFNLGRRLFLEGDEDLISTLTPRVPGKKPKEQLFIQSIEESMLPWQNKKVIVNLFREQLEKLVKHFPEVKRTYVAQYLHDLYIYDRGARVPQFIAQAAELGTYFKDSNELRAMALRTLAKSYFIKDEVFVSHIMISPQKRAEDKKRFGSLGKGIRLSRINRPAFEVFGKKIEFDVSPKDWMLKIMRHLRFLRLFLRAWHSKERSIAKAIRKELLEVVPKLAPEERRSAIKRLENIKGYREVRYEKAEPVVQA